MYIHIIHCCYIVGIQWTARCWTKWSRIKPCLGRRYIDCKSPWSLIRRYGDAHSLAHIELYMCMYAYTRACVHTRVTLLCVHVHMCTLHAYTCKQFIHISYMVTREHLRSIQLGERVVIGNVALHIDNVVMIIVMYITGGRAVKGEEQWTWKEVV